MTLVWRRQCDRLLCVCVCVRVCACACVCVYSLRRSGIIILLGISIRTLRTACILHIGEVAPGILGIRFLSFPILERDGSEWPASLPGRFTFGEMAPGTGQACLDIFERDSSLPLLGIEPRLVSFPARGQVTVPPSLLRCVNCKTNSSFSTFPLLPLNQLATLNLLFPNFSCFSKLSHCSGVGLPTHCAK